MNRATMLDIAHAVAAVSAGVHGNVKWYKKFYDRYCDEVGGFPGIWSLCVDAGIALNAAYVKHERLVGKETDFIAAVDMLVDMILVHKGEKAPTVDELRTWAAAAVHKHSK